MIIANTYSPFQGGSLGVFSLGLLVKTKDFILSTGRYYGENVLGLSERNVSSDVFVSDKLRRIFVITYGTAVGFAAGTISSLINYKSLNHRSKRDCWDYDNWPVLGPMNTWREKQFRSHSISMFFIASVLFAAYNGLKKNEENELRTPFKVLLKSEVNFWSLCVSPYFNGESAFILVMIIRQCIKIPAEDKFDIDVSGHACIHLVNLFTKLAILETIQKMGASSKINAIFLGVLGAGAFVEIPWTFNTTANCHSILDVVTAAAIASISHFFVNKCLSPLMLGIKNVSTALLGSLCSRMVSSVRPYICKKNAEKVVNPSSDPDVDKLTEGMGRLSIAN